MGQFTFLSVLFILLSYLAAAAFFGGLLYKLLRYAVTPAPLKIPITPHPKTAGGVVWKNTVIISTFSPIFKSNKWIWAGGIVFHIILLLVILRHLRYFMEPVPEIITFLQSWGIYAGLLIPLPIIYKIGMRAMIDRLRYISYFPDYFLLFLILLIALSGLTIKFILRSDVVGIKQFIMGLVVFSPVNIPMDFFFLLHFSLVLILLAYMPFSKLILIGGIFLSPTRVQVENVREVRHVNPWAAKKERK